MGKSTFSGPVAGAYICTSFSQDVSAGGTATMNFHVPDGQTWKFFGASFYTGAASGTHTTTVVVNGNALFTTQATTNTPNYVAAGTAYEATDGQTVSITLVADGAVAMTDATIVLYAYVKNHADAL